MANCERVSPLEALWLCKMGLSASSWSQMRSKDKARSVFRMAMADKVLMPDQKLREIILRVDAFAAGSPPAGSVAVAEETCSVTPASAPSTTNPRTDNASESTPVADLQARSPVPPSVTSGYRTPLMSVLIPVGIGALAFYAYRRYRQMRRGR